ncbi:ImmA/IrrE family metallo-endopeptidase [Chitinophaga horti]|uniref:ImmA/IrrE family metallo-endopeptidase n=1 Tax=Chitinophaga horti TaxID=2920382 RepID=A0ABY6J0A1_9BACT|nr:ImmA/IrrE family metallo-endopeptidase [Chitinophaga horti]UYQ92851.1 ImmA/IrrE family metallo-endopeptidase [Chitinophaga horti]
MISVTEHQILKETQIISKYLAYRYCNNVSTNLLEICEEEALHIISDDYKEYFDGMLVWDSSDFHIHLNTAKGNLPSTKRGRFTLAHELGHYFIDAHRESLKSGTLPSHPSHQSLIHNTLMERQADHFAACLLMPEERLRAMTGGRKFSLDIIKELSKSFDVSLTAALLRFLEVGTHDIMIVFSQDNIVKWTKRSDRFPKLANKFKIGGALPPTSVAGESFLKMDAKYTTVEPVSLDDWFEDRGWNPGPMFEQCFYSDLYNYAISMVWFK